MAIPVNQKSESTSKNEDFWIKNSCSSLKICFRHPWKQSNVYLWKHRLWKPTWMKTISNFATFWFIRVLKPGTKALKIETITLYRPIALTKTLMAEIMPVVTDNSEFIIEINQFSEHIFSTSAYQKIEHFGLSSFQRNLSQPYTFSNNSQNNVDGRVPTR